MMNKTNSTSSNNSATSSETSETHSVEENIPDSNPTLQQNNTSGRVLKNLKKMKDLGSEKEGETKRPPWRAVSLSTLPKPDKNALLRAKLLDASRRMRAGKTSVAVQTDIVPTKLMKEVNFGVQVDLILHKEVGMLTDGSYAKKRDGSNEYILTYSISQMTDKLTSADASTQTLLPKLCTESVVNPDMDVSSSGVEFIALEQKVKDQLTKLKKSLNNAQVNVGAEEANAINNNNRRPLGIVKPTISSWHFDYDTIKIDADEHFIPYTIQAGKPWSSFVPLPFRLGGKGLIGHQHIDWYALLNSIDCLVNESNVLMDTLEQLMEEKKHARLLIANSVQRIPKYKFEPFVPPSDHWLPIIEQQERELEIMIGNRQSAALLKSTESV